MTLKSICELVTSRHSIIDRSIRAAKENLRLHQTSARLRYKQVLSMADCLLSEASQYISRYLADFTIMKKLPLDEFLFSLNSLEGASSLSDVASPEWEAQFMGLTEIKRILLAG